MSAGRHAARMKVPDAGSAASGKAVFRHRGMMTGLALGTCLLLLLMAVAWSELIPGNIVGTAVLAVGLWFIWAVGWWTKIVVSEHGVEIDNVFVRHVIPWKAFSEFTVDGGLVATLSDGTRVGIVSFGGSLAGALTHYRGLSKKRDALVAACKRFKLPGAELVEPRHRQVIATHWVALLLYVVPLTGIAFGIDLSQHVL